MAAVDFCLGMTGAAVFDSDYAINTIIPFTKRHNWFVPTYLALMCLAPLLNKALNAAGKKELGGWMAVLTLLNLYAYFFTVGSINPNGYTLFQFIYLYVLGFYLRMAGRVKRFYSMAVYIAGALAAFIISQTCMLPIRLLRTTVRKCSQPRQGCFFCFLHLISAAEW